MPVQRWVTASDVACVADVRRSVVDYAAKHGVGDAVLADLAIAVSEVLTNVALHGRPVDPVTTTAELADGELVVVVDGAGFGLSTQVDAPAVRLGMVVAAALTGNIRVCPAAGGGREIWMSFPIAEEPLEGFGADGGSAAQGSPALTGAEPAAQPLHARA